MKRTLCILSGIYFVSALLGAAWIRVSEPNAGSEWCLGQTYTIRWTKSADAPGTVTIRLRRAGAPDSERAVLAIARNVDNDLSEPWTVPNTLAAGDYFIRVQCNPELRGDSPAFKIKSCVQLVGPPPPELQIGPRVMVHSMTLPVTFSTKHKTTERHSANCLQRMGTGAIEVPPTEMLVGFFNRREDRGLLCADECVSQIYRGSPLWDAARLATLVGKTIVSATLSIRHKSTEAAPPCALCLKHIYWYAGRMGESNPSPTISPPLPLVVSGAYRIDVTEMMRNWLREEDPSYRGEHHNYRMEFVGNNERMEFNSQKCLSWFDSGSLEIKYRD
jgi:hypothetical protein